MVADLLQKPVINNKLVAILEPTFFHNEMHFLQYGEQVDKCPYEVLEECWSTIYLGTSSMTGMVTNR